MQALQTSDDSPGATTTDATLGSPTMLGQFAALDEHLTRASASASANSVVIVRAPANVHRALTAHVMRRLPTAIEASARAGAPLFHDVASHLSLATTTPLPCNPESCSAKLIAAASSSGGLTIAAALPPPGSWDHAVASAIHRQSKRSLLVFLTTPDARVDAWKLAAVFDVSSSLLNDEEKICWLSAITNDNAHRDLDLNALEDWWQHAREASSTTFGRPTQVSDSLRSSTSGATSALPSLTEPAREALSYLDLAGRTLAIASLPPAAASAIDELKRHKLVIVRDGNACLAASHREQHIHVGRAAHVARLLQENYPHDPWAQLRAAELLIAANEEHAKDADDAISRAFACSEDDPHLNREIAARWFLAVAKLPAGQAHGAHGGASSSPGFGLRVKAAERALALGDALSAKRWCESAAAARPNDPTVSYLMGRALLQLGDLVAARVCFVKAEECANANDNNNTHSEMLARVAVERAEVSYLAGDLDQAAEHAKRALTLIERSSGAKTAAVAAAGGAIRLSARGTLGKVLLARRSWDLADAHFAEDAIVAASLGDRAADLRARLNRAIALLSKDRLEEARLLLEGVIEEGARIGEQRALAYGLSNLGLVAYRERNYGAALMYWERTTGGACTALTIANLADLRIRLGLLELAEQTAAQCKKPMLSRHARWIAAQIALARRDTELARREIESAILDAEAFGDRDCLESAYVVSARIALEDGDLAHMAASLTQAERVAKTPRAFAEIAIVRVAQLRALGQPTSALENAAEALTLARQSGEDDLLVEIHTLLALLYRDRDSSIGNDTADNTVAARTHVAHAMAIRDRIATTLPAEARAAFLAKPESRALTRLQDRQPLSTPPPQAPTRERERERERELIGDDPAIQSLVLAIRKVARSNSTVLIRGESGTGKELVAEALHRASDCGTGASGGPLVSVNCAALASDLLLSELFGHEKGSFTGASSRRRGRFEMAEGGTLFLDEIGDITSATQVALLRVLQEKTFERVGGTTSIQANVRIVCATHRDLKAMVARGEFREDLYYRLRGITLEVPPLRARIGDLPKIAEHLLARIAVERGPSSSSSSKRLHPDALDLLCRYRWPGNIRELENVLRAVTLFAEDEEITLSDLIDNVEELRSLPQRPQRRDRDRDRDDDDEADDSGEETSSSAKAIASSVTADAYTQVRRGTISLSAMKRELERDCVARALLETDGNITQAALLLGMKRPRLSQLVKQYNLG